MNDLKMITEQITTKLNLDQWGKLQLDLLVKGESVNPTWCMDMTDVAILSKRLNEIGLTNSFTMGRYPDDVSWKLSKNGLSNYIEKNRSETINELLS